MYRLTTIHLVTYRQTDRQTDNIMMAIVDIARVSTIGKKKKHIVYTQ